MKNMLVFREVLYDFGFLLSPRAHTHTHTHTNITTTTGTYGNVFAAAMTSGLFYATVTMPFESAKNRMAFQKPDSKTGKLPYTSTFQAIASVARKDGVLSLWRGFAPYYTRCGGHTCTMFVFVEWMRKVYNDMN